MNTFKSKKGLLLGIIAIAGVMIGLVLNQDEKEKTSTAEEGIVHTATAHEDNQANPIRVESVKFVDPLEGDAEQEIAEKLLEIADLNLDDNPELAVPDPPPSIGSPLFSDVHELNRASLVRDSPDGRYLAYLYPGGLTYDSGLYIRDGATGEIREILDIDNQYIGVGGLTWSDDSRSLTFIYEDTRKNESIEVPLNKFGPQTLLKTRWTSLRTIAVEDGAIRTITDDVPNILSFAGVRNGLAYVVTRNSEDKLYSVRTINLANGSSELRYEFPTQVQESESGTVRHYLNHFQLRPNSEEIYFVRSGTRYPVVGKQEWLPATIRSIDLASADFQTRVVLAPNEDVSDIQSFAWDSSGDQIAVSSGKGIGLFTSDLRRVGHFDMRLGTQIRSFTNGRLIVPGTAMNYKDPSAWTSKYAPRSHYVVRADEIPPVS